MSASHWQKNVIDSENRVLVENIGTKEEVTGENEKINNEEPHNLYTWPNIIKWIWHSEDRASWYILIIETNEMHQFLKFIFGIELCMFQTVSLSIIRRLVLYTQQ